MVRPVKELPARDMAMVCHLRGLHLAPLPLMARSGGRPSLNALCREFVAGMQAGLPSTVSTIVRTASKLKVRGGRGLPLTAPIVRHDDGH